MYKIQIIKSADKLLKTLQQKDRIRIAEAIQLLSENPRPAGYKKLKDTDFYRIRIGDYRVVYKIADGELLVLVIRIGHRKDIYK